MIINSYRFGGYSTEYQAILTRATALGATHPSTAIKIKGDAMIASLKSNGIWSRLDVLWVLSTDGDSNFALINWKDPDNFLCTKVLTPTFTSNSGYKSASLGYLNTGWNPSTNGVNYLLDDASAFTYIKGNAISANTDFGANDSTNQVDIVARRTSTISRGPINQGANNNIGNSVANDGLHMTSRALSTEYNFYVPTQFSVNVVSNSTGIVNLPVFICCLNFNGSPLVYETVRTQALIGFGDNLQDKITELYSAIDTYMA